MHNRFPGKSQRDSRIRVFPQGPDSPSHSSLALWPAFPPPAVPYRVFRFSVVSQTPLCVTLPTKELCVKMILCSPFWKKCFHQVFKLKLGYSTGNVQNQMQINRLQMQIVLLKGPFSKKTAEQAVVNWVADRSQ